MGFPVFPRYSSGVSSPSCQEGEAGWGRCLHRQAPPHLLFFSLHSTPTSHCANVNELPATSTSRYADTEEPKSRRAAAPTRRQAAAPTSRRAAARTATRTSRYGWRHGQADTGTATYVHGFPSVWVLLFGFYWVSPGFYMVFVWFSLGFIWGFYRFLSVFGVGWSGDVKGWGSLTGEGKPVAG
jgi:hypothetical protein